jgi:exosome complex RNA-binding protein Rrp42 (RNase PH superfamily)
MQRQACRTLLPCIQQVLTEQVAGIVERLVDARQLCIAAGKAAWLAYLDIYILDAGGTGLCDVQPRGWSSNL